MCLKWSYPPGLVWNCQVNRVWINILFFIVKKQKLIFVLRIGAGLILRCSWYTRLHLIKDLSWMYEYNFIRRNWKLMMSELKPTSTRSYWMITKIFIIFLVKAWAPWFTARTKLKCACAFIFYTYDDTNYHHFFYFLCILANSFFRVH